MLACRELSDENITSNKFMFHHAWRLRDHALTSFYFCVNATLRPKVNIFIQFFNHLLLSDEFELVLSLSLTENYQNIHLSKIQPNLSLKSTTEK